MFGCGAQEECLRGIKEAPALAGRAWYVFRLDAGEYIPPRLDGLGEVVVGEHPVHRDIATALFGVVWALGQ